MFFGVGIQLFELVTAFVDGQYTPYLVMATCQCHVPVNGRVMPFMGIGALTAVVYDARRLVPVRPDGFSHAW